MSKEPNDKKIEEGKKATKAANKKLAANKLNREVKKLSDKAVMEIAAELPAGSGNEFVRLHHEHQKAEAEVAKAGKLKREVRAKMKSIKVDMASYDRVNKLSKMDPNDVAAKKATEALYEKQLSMPLSADQQKIMADIQKKRDDARKAVIATSDGNTGKEVGSGTDKEAKESSEDTIPERNEAVSSNYAAAPAAGTIQ